MQSAIMLINEVLITSPALNLFNHKRKKKLNNKYKYLNYMHINNSTNQ